MGVVVVGAGIAGIACARVLHDAGVAVRVIERAEDLGGRMASPTFDGRRVDVGAAYFTARDPEFAALVDGWRQQGLVRPWSETMAVFQHGVRGVAPGPMRWAAAGGLAGLVEELAVGLRVERGRAVARVGPGPVVDGQDADVVVVAMPDPQAARIIAPESPAAAQLRGRTWTPVLSVVMRWRTRTWAPLPAAFVNGHPLLTTVADDGDRRGDGAPVLVAHTSEAGAEAEPEEVVDAVRALLGITTPPASVHERRWPHASPVGGRDAPFHLGEDGIALAGDGWGASRVETAWRSGTLLGRSLAERSAAD